ncbi:MAG TPA: hypothetical protein PK605_07265 [Ignavibacteria bacterium]|nr:hypothetical protein [Bacteroidota bacterium]HRE09418.1 hypothetical protein [Ignavibacteria bacterium]HRF64543.1 hypothetical protein [Ignavibacteria bacterium]HRJ04185.1 hypothetical protein [Ignavibacteria bacterium]HRJ84505.1 hypothetical protein [Ignavibacteria bacterium]
MDPKILLVLVPVLVVPWIVLYFVLIASNKKVVSNYRKLNDKYQLDTDLSKKVGMKTHPCAEGIYRSRQVKIESVVRDSVDGNKVIPHTVLTVDCANTDNFHFKVVKRNKKNTQNYSAGSTLVDDSEFDDKFIITTNNPGKVKRIFDFNTKFKLDQVSALGFSGLIALEGNRLIYMEPELLASDDSLMRIELMMHEFCDIAEVMRYN